MIKAVSFDLWFTLIWEKHPEDELLYTRLRAESVVGALRSRGYEVPLDAVLGLYRRLGASRMLLNSRGVASLILAGLGLGPSDDLVEEVARAYELSTDAFRPRENPEALRILGLLKSSGIRVAIVSNTSFSARGVRAILSNVGISDYVDVIVSSSDVGYLKPQRRIFQSLLEALGVKASEVVHVGDSCVDDVLGALASGLGAVYYTGLLPLRGAEPDALCLSLVPTIGSLDELGRLLSLEQPWTAKPGGSSTS